MPAADGEALSDAELLRRHVAGDTDAFGELFRRHRDRLWAVALRTLCDPDEAADALQDAMVSAFRRAGDFRGDSAVTTWLHRIVVNASLDRLRRKAARPTALVGDASSLESSVGVDPAGNAEVRLDVNAALRVLPPQQRAALVVVDMLGFSVADAAEILSISPGTVKSRCARARARLLPYVEHLRGIPIDQRERLTCAGRRCMTGHKTHPDPDTLADFQAGLISGRRARILTDHLGSCGKCTAIGDRLADVCVLLAAAPALTIPDSVAQRLELALGDEALRRQAHPQHGAQEGERARPRLERRVRLRPLSVRVLVPATTAMAVLAAGGYGLSQIGGPASPAASPGGVVAAPAARAKSTAPPSHMGNEHAADGGETGAVYGPADLKVVSSDINFEPNMLVSQLQAELRQPPAVSVSPATPTLVGCVRLVTGGGTPVLVENARYQGRPATVIVVAAGTGNNVWVVGPQCSASNRSQIATAILP